LTVIISSPWLFRAQDFKSRPPLLSSGVTHRRWRAAVDPTPTTILIACATASFLLEMARDNAAHGEDHSPRRLGQASIVHDRGAARPRVTPRSETISPDLSMAIENCERGMRTTSGESRVAGRTSDLSLVSLVANRVGWLLAAP
jgi:hypothetical protein